jgi:hypothetical protein
MQTEFCRETSWIEASQMNEKEHFESKIPWEEL